MRYISENQPPPELILWLREQRKAGVNLRYDDLSPVEINSEQRDVRKAIVEQRLKDQGYLCAYTMLRIEADSCHVEHIYPRTLSYAEGDPEKTVEYTNIVACYPFEETGNKRGKCPFGAVARESNILGLHPLDPNCQKRLRYQSNGRVLATRADDWDGIKLIDPAGQLLRLNHPKLVKWRKSSINEAGLGIKSSSPLSEASATRLKTEVLQFKAGEKLKPFCVALAHAVDDHLRRLKKRRDIKRHLQTKPKR
jgi:uncharacterized protein (TIGR02646 family)